MVIFWSFFYKFFTFKFSVCFKAALEVMLIFDDGENLSIDYFSTILPEMNFSNKRQCLVSPVLI